MDLGTKEFSIHISHKHYALFSLKQLLFKLFLANWKYVKMATSQGYVKFALFWLKIQIESQIHLYFSAVPN